MPDLFGKTWTKDELRRRVGDISQLAGIERDRQVDVLV